MSPEYLYYLVFTHNMRQSEKLKTQPRHPQSLELCIWLLVAALIWPTHTAHAYVDPGTGSFIVQIIIGLFFGIAYTVRRFWSTIIGWFRKGSVRDGSVRAQRDGGKKTDDQ
jgi:hypothetical protein